MSKLKLSIECGISMCGFQGKPSASIIVAFTTLQLEELKQQQKLERQQERKRKLEVNPGDEQSNVQPQQVGLSLLN